ncbi:MAG: ATP-binding protein, partial [Thermoleophilaceae bacterium]
MSRGTLPAKTLRSVRGFARRHDLLRPGPLVVAVSGGADSTALLLLLGELADELGLVLHAAHFDH